MGLISASTSALLSRRSLFSLAGYERIACCATLKVPHPEASEMGHAWQPAAAAAEGAESGDPDST